MMMFMMIMVRMMRMRKRVEVEVGWRLEARSVRSGQEDKEQEGFRQMGSDKITIPVHLIIIRRRILIDHHGGRLPCLVLIVIISNPCQALTSTHNLTRAGFFIQTRLEVKKPTYRLALVHHHHRLEYNAHHHHHQIGAPGLYI